MTSIVLTHGFGGSRAHWDTMVPTLADRATVVSWDLPGHGAGPVPDDGDYSRELALERLNEMVAASEPPRVLVGHSLGGYLSMAHTIRRPHDSAALVLLATGPGFRSPERREAWNRSVRQAEATFDVATGSAGLVEQHDSLVMDGLRTISVPTVLVLGERDRRFRAAHDLLAHRLDATSVTVAGAGHLVMQTHGAEVAAHILAFMDRLRL